MYNLIQGTELLWFLKIAREWQLLLKSLGISACSFCNWDELNFMNAVS